MELYRVSSEEELTPQVISALIDRYKMKEVKRLKTLHEYYIGQSEIKRRAMSDPAKPNNKVANNFPGYITDTIQGYFMGKPVSYKSEDEDHMIKVQDVFDRNHEQAHNAKLGKQLSITGVAHELVYMDENNNVRLAVLDPQETFMIYDDTIEQNPLAGVRFYTIQDYVSDKPQTKVEVYTGSAITYYEYRDESLKEVDDEEHYFGAVPINVYWNNDVRMGDFEKVMDQIDAYDKAVSDTSNDLEYFADAYLVLKGMEQTEQKDIADMKENRVMLITEGGEAQWLTKDINTEQAENYKDRLRRDIHTFSFVPDMSDENFGMNLSGISIKYKLFGLEQIVGTKERLFKQSLEKRIELITKVLNLKGGTHDAKDIKMNFSRNLPVNTAEWADMAVKLHGMLSDETVVSLLPFVEDVAQEMDKKAAQEADDLLAYPELNPVEVPKEE